MNKYTIEQLKVLAINRFKNLFKSEVFQTTANGQALCGKLVLPDDSIVHLLICKTPKGELETYIERAGTKKFMQFGEVIMEVERLIYSKEELEYETKRFTDSGMTEKLNIYKALCHEPEKAVFVVKFPTATIEPIYYIGEVYSEENDLVVFKDGNYIQRVKGVMEFERIKN